MRRPGFWRRVSWSLTPIGRVRLALVQADAGDRGNKARARLTQALAVLRHPGRAGRPAARQLLPQVLARLTALALDGRDLATAERHLDNLARISGDTEVRRLRWRLIEAWRRTGNATAAFRQAIAHISDSRCPVDEVTALLTWALSLSLERGREMASAVPRGLPADPLLDTLVAIGTAPGAYDDPREAERIVGLVNPQLLADHPQLAISAHLLRVKGAETIGDWETMLAEADQALMVDGTRTDLKYWRARSLVHAGRNEEASAELVQPPVEAGPEWRRLIYIESLLAEPRLERVEAVTTVIEGVWGRPDKNETAMALTALEPVLRAEFVDPPARLAVIGEYSARVTGAVGPLPWTEYNLALADLRVNHAYARAAERLAGAAAPPGGCPAHLLRAACSLILGQRNGIEQALSVASPVPAAFAPETDFLLEAQAFFRGLDAGEGEFGWETDDDLGAPTLLHAVPILDSISRLLRETARIAAGEHRSLSVTAAELEGCPWAQWLRARLELALAPVGELAGHLAVEPAEADHPALIWERMLWCQEYATLWPQLAAMLPVFWSWLAEKDRVPEGSCRAGLLLSRRQLFNAGAVSPRAADALVDSCPFWPPDGVLQGIARSEAEVDRCYLTGRGLLRAGRTEEAVKWFARAGGLFGAPLRHLLVGSLHGPLLAYWSGVALARQGRDAEAEQLLHGCLDGPKAHEALAQMGLAALKQGRAESAEEMLERIASPVPPSARYLASLLAEGRGDLAGACAQLALIPETEGPVPATYAAAARRLRGRIAECLGDLERALAEYREALAAWPDDPVTIARLGRVHLRVTCHHRRNGEAPTDEPVLAPRWDRMREVEWAAGLPSLKTWFAAACGGGEPAPAPHQLEDGRSRGHTALRRLALRRLLLLGRRAEALDTVRGWLDGSGDQHHFKAISLILEHDGLLRAFCLDRTDADLRREVEALSVGLDGLADRLPGDPALAFWQSTARFLLDPELRHEDGFFRGVLDGPDGPPAWKAFAAVAGLFSAQPALRVQAQAACRALLAGKSVADERAENVVACLTAHAAGDDERFLIEYARLERDPSCLPCSEGDIFVAACEARLRMGQMDAITDGYIPESLASLQDASVRRLIGLAFARRAARNADRDARAALQDLEQASNMLRAAQEAPDAAQEG